MSTTTIFSGSSRFSKDFASVIDRAVGIASLPLSQLNSGKARLTAESGAVASLDMKFSALQTAMNAIQTAVTTGSYDKSLSNASVASVTLGTTVLEGTYALNVTALGASSTSLSKSGLIAVSDPSTQNISASAGFTLVVDGVSHAITPAASTLSALASAINDDATAGVSATIVNMGNSGTPDYRLSLQSKKLGAVSIDLTDAGGSIIDPISTGTKATYQLNGILTTIQSDSRTITLAPGITVDLLAEGTSTIGITRSLTSVSNALISFATAYNSAVGELDKHRGEGGGALAGQSLVSSLSDALRKISGYTTGSGSIASLTSLGLSFDKAGLLSLNTADFATATTNKFSTLSSFLGTTSTTGFLKAVTDTLTGIEDPLSGILKSSVTTIATEIAGQQKLIDANQDRVDRLRQSLTAQFAGVDALIASLEQQVLYMNGLFGAILNPPK